MIKANKKLLSLVLGLSMVLSAPGSAFAADTQTPAPKDLTDVKGTSYEVPVNVLVNLGVVSGYPDGTYQPAKTVTRAEMSALIIRAMGLENLVEASGNKTVFSDVPSTHWAAKYVNFASDMKIVVGVGDGKFAPEATLTIPQCVTMIERAMGYTDGSDHLTGTWPANYIVLATQLGLFDDVEAKSGNADRGSIAQMLFNGIDVEHVAVNADGETNPIEESCFLKELGATLEPKDIIDEDVVYSDDTLIDLSQYVFAETRLYTNDDEVIAMGEITNDYATGVFDKDDETLTIDKSEKDLDIDGSTPVFMNGGTTTLGASINGTDVIDWIDGAEVTVYGTESGGDFTEVEGIVAVAPTDLAVQLDDNDVDDIADIYAGDADDLFGYDLPTDTGNDVDFDMVSDLGEISLKDAKEDDVVLVYQAGGSTDRIGFEVVRAAVTGEVDSLRVGTNDVAKITVKGTSYEVSDYAAAGLLDSINDAKPGTNVTIYLDSLGKVAFVNEADESVTTEDYAIFIEDDQDFSDWQTKVLTADGTKKVFDVDDDYAYDTADYTADDIVTYELNNADEITDMTVVDPADTDARLDGVVADRVIAKYTARTKLLTGHYYNVATEGAVFSKVVAASPVVFDITGTPDTVKLVDGATYTFNCYTLNDDNKVEMMVLSAASVGAEDETYMVVTDVASVLNSDKDIVFKVTGFVDGQVTSLYTEDDDLTIDENTLYNFTMDDGLISAIADEVGLAVADFDFAGETNEITSVDDDDAYYRVGTSIYEISEDAVVIKAVADTDNEVDTFKIGSLSDIRDGYSVICADSDEDTDGYEIIIVANPRDFE